MSLFRRGWAAAGGGGFSWVFPPGRAHPGPDEHPGATGHLLLHLLPCQKWWFYWNWNFLVGKKQFSTGKRQKSGRTARLQTPNVARGGRAEEFLGMLHLHRTLKKATSSEFLQNNCKNIAIIVSLPGLVAVDVVWLLPALGCSYHPPVGIHFHDV